MAKNFIKPIILRSGSDWGGDGSDIGGGSGGSSPDITVVSFDEWVEMYGGEDYDLDGDTDDFDDYMQWWYDNDLGEDAWNEINPGVPFAPPFP